MSSLAQSIIDTAHNLKTKPDRLMRDAYESLSKSSNPLLSERAQELSTMFLALSGGSVVLAEKLPKAMRFSIDQNVADAVLKMSQTPVKTLLEAIKYAKPPNPITWIEFNYRDNSIRSGWLIEDTKAGIQISKVMSTATTNHMPIFESRTGVSIIDENGIRYADASMQRASVSADLKDMSEDAQLGTLQSTLSLLLLMNSRSRILKTEESTVDLYHEKQRRRIRNLAAPMSLNTISFDLSRTLGKNENFSDEECGRIMATSLVRGHFKIRQTGVFFWSPYVRNAPSEETKEQAMIDGLNRERLVTNSGGMNLTLPGKDGPPM